MTIIIFFFFLSALISVIATPYVSLLGRRIGALDYPGGRKIHEDVTPRCGGLSIFLGFFLPFVSLLFYRHGILNLISWDSMTIGFTLGSTCILLIGLWDDIRRLRAPIKFILQILAAFIAWYSGFRIDVVVLPYLGVIEFHFLGLPLTILWFLAIINAINLVDGLDGLAAGVALFASIILAIISLLWSNFLAALMYACLSGALLGFLRYNFNPASIFLGDSGSYFIGYVLAALGLATSQKSSVTVAILIPIIALGLPLMDMMITTIRRFIFGANIFAPDKEHMHHRLLRLGYSQRKATLVFYGITIMLGSVSLLIVNARDERAGFILGALAIMSAIGIRKLGYLEYFTTEKILGWFADVTDEVGMTQSRRTFLSEQVAIAGSRNIYQFWYRTARAAERIYVGRMSMVLDSEAFGNGSLPSFVWRNQEMGGQYEDMNHNMSVEMPLVSNGTFLGRLRFEIPLNGNGQDRYVLKRMEQLRRTAVKTLEQLAERSVEDATVLKDRRAANDSKKDGTGGNGNESWCGVERRRGIESN